MTTTKKKLAKGVALSAVTVSSLEETKRIFCDLLGLEVKEHDEKFKWMELGGEEGGLVGFGEPMAEDMKAGTNAVVSISVENVAEARAFLESNEVQFLGDTVEIPGEVKLAMFADKDGNQYFLAEHLK
ncbi:MAG: VOC family protein [Chlamydiia bacterium]|nr:VOC family protein [Chlamydiia bacterium]MCB1116076.1 VOC family protein [Chlamydiia bacterium]